MKSKRKSITFKITVAGVSAALVTAFLAAAAYSPIGKISFYILAGLCLILPLTVDSLWACFMAYVAGGALGLIFSVVGVLPYVLIFGLQTVLFGVCIRFKIKPYVYLPVKGGLFVGALFVVFKIYGLASIQGIFERVGIPFKFLYLALILTPFYVAYDYCFKYIYGWIKRRLSKVTKKYLPLEKKPADEDDVFSFDDQKENDNNNNNN